MRTPEDNIKFWMEKFPFVKWDRFIESKLHYQVFGWIDREDNYKDFMLIIFLKETGAIVYWISSSHTRHEEIIKLLGKRAVNNFPCQRIADLSKKGRV